jgi:hypothetical protein
MTITTEEAERLAVIWWTQTMGGIDYDRYAGTATALRSLAAERDMWRGENIKKTTACEQMGARIQAFEAENARLQEALSEMITAFYDAGCHVCGGDCASANPPVWGCPVDVIRRARVLGEKE